MDRRERDAWGAICLGLVVVALVALVALFVTPARSHDPYSHLYNPNTGAHCCNMQKDDGTGDCRPGAVWRDGSGKLWARVEGQSMPVPESALIPAEKNPHQPVGLICEKGGNFYCVAMSGAGI